MRRNVYKPIYYRNSEMFCKKYISFIKVYGVIIYMKFNGLFIVLGILFLISGVSAYSVFVADPVITPSDTNPLTSSLYFKFNIDLNATAYSGGADPTLDFNSQSLCWYSVTDSNTMLAATFEDTTSPCVLLDYHNAQNGDFNFKMIVQNGQGDVNYETGWVHAWSDENAPVSTYGTVTENPGEVIIPVYCSDGMTAQESGENELPETEQGVGCKGVWYYDTADGNTWNWLPGYSVETGWENPVNIRVTGTGDHTIYWCVEDRLDTNSCNVDGEWYKDVSIESFSNGACSLVGILQLVLVAVVIVLILGTIGLIASGNADISTLTPMGIGVIVLLIVLIIIGYFIPAICIV